MTIQQSSNKFRFTISKLEKLESASRRYIVRDIETHGLSLEVMPTGKKIFRFVAMINHRRYNVSLGQFPSFSIINARQRCSEIYLALSAGEPLPSAKKSAEQRQRRCSDLFKARLEWFDTQIRAKNRKLNSKTQFERIWKNHLATVLNKLYLTDITSTEAKTILNTIQRKSSNAIYNKCVTYCKSMFNFACENDWIKSNPFDNISKVAERPRERFLTINECRKLLESTMQETVDGKNIVVIALFTGQRKTNVLSMKWSDLDRELGIWRLSSNDTKNKKQHSLPLPSLVREALDEQWQIRQKEVYRKISDYVFASRSSESGHITEKTGKGSFWYRIRERAKLDNVRFHDLRRTLASLSVQNGQSIQSISKILGHSDISITSAVYGHLDVHNMRETLDQLPLLIEKKQKYLLPTELIQSVNRLKPDELRLLAEFVNQRIALLDS